MGLILDSSVLIASERRGESIKQLIDRLRLLLNDADSAISAITVIELTHGIYCARTDADRLRRRTFTEDIFQSLVVHPVSLEIAKLAGRVEGEQAAIGISIAIEDIIIGATALHLGFDVLALNVKHFRFIPSLKIVTV